ncbi:hypothetical protein GOP47_0014487 [Adiantum capillus-veneris]|uniref:Thiol methyltransferase 2 n=1 Tax=Adiantum capillus-veneris TaxID=13818 RepID=A0A9D4ULK4_ADICA|nr:hypothetical protein GOP47_0014487 [Adiantum capillus-veneris]
MLEANNEVVWPTTIIAKARTNVTRSWSYCVIRGGNLMNPSSNTDGEDFNAKKVTSLQSILKASNSWEQCWVEDVTPWDLGKVTPVVADLVERNNLPVGRALVPGCGSGYDVVALASRARHVIGLDISATAVEHAQKIWAGTKSINVEFVCWDFFNYMPGAPFDLILDYTFFCALQPSMRPLWGSKIADLLSSEGELITIMFPMDSFEGGPPYAVSLAAYENALHPQGLRCTFFQENALAVGKRKIGPSVCSQLWRFWQLIPLLYLVTPSGPRGRVTAAPSPPHQLHYFSLHKVLDLLQFVVPDLCFCSQHSALGLSHIRSADQPKVCQNT